MGIQVVLNEPVTVREDSILFESETGKMYLLNPDTTIVPNSHIIGREKEFEDKLKEFLFKFNISKHIEILCK